jgi:predicted nuclease of predicted toxin-antitoxin system
MNSFFVDECLTPELVTAAHARGFEATHVIFLQRDGASDWAIAQLVLARDDILVTNSSRDFLAIYARFELHPGLVVILPSAARAEQLALFNLAIDEIERRSDIVNQVIEVSRDGTVKVMPWSALDFDPSRKDK